MSELAEVPLETSWCRVSKRGMWHRVVGWRNGGALQTACGRVYLPAKVRTYATGEKPGTMCGHCAETT